MYKLILLRHGQSQWNLENRFTGWKDIALSKKGIEEAVNAGKLMSKHNFLIDMIFCSVLQRAIETAKLAILEMNLKNLWNEKNELIMIKDQALNERNYGDLVGLNKQETVNKFGKEQVHLWRRSFEVSPPGGESLKDTSERVIPYFKKNIAPLLKQSKQILITAHGNSLRALVKYLDNLDSYEVVKLELQTGIPIVYKINSEGVIASKTLISLNS